MAVCKCPQLPQPRIILSARIRSGRPRSQQLCHLGFSSDAFSLTQLRIGCRRHAPERGKLSRSAGTSDDEFLVLDGGRLFNRDDRSDAGIPPRHRILIRGGSHRCRICIRLLPYDQGLGGWNDCRCGIFKGRGLATRQNDCRKQAKPRTVFSLKVHVLFRSGPVFVMTTTKK